MPPADQCTIHPTCPDDLGQLDCASGKMHCQLCGRQFQSVDGIFELLPRQALTENTLESLRLNAYRASFPNRPERPWRRSLAVLTNKLGNRYLYSWAARRLETIAHGRALQILDAACGDGILLRYLSARHVYVGVDFSMRPLARARRYNSALYFRADLNYLPFATGTFDAVLSLQALQYLDRPEVALAHMARVLKPGGRLLLTVPNGESFKYRFQGTPQIQLQRFDRHSLRSLVAQDFEILDARTRGLWVPVPIISVHAPGTYPVRWGLSWTVDASPRK